MVVGERDGRGVEGMLGGRGVLCWGRGEGGVMSGGRLNDISRDGFLQGGESF